MAPRSIPPSRLVFLAMLFVACAAFEIDAQPEIAVSTLALPANAERWDAKTCLSAARAASCAATWIPPRRLRCKRKTRPAALSRRFRAIGRIRPQKCFETLKTLARRQRAAHRNDTSAGRDPGQKAPPRKDHHARASPCRHDAGISTHCHCQRFQLNPTPTDFESLAVLSKRSRGHWLPARFLSPGRLTAVADRQRRAGLSHGRRQGLPGGRHRGCSRPEFASEGASSS